MTAQADDREVAFNFKPDLSIDVYRLDQAGHITNLARWRFTAIGVFGFENNERAFIPWQNIRIVKQ